MSPEEVLNSLYTQENVQADYSYLREMPSETQMKGNCPVGVGQGVAAQVCKTPLIAPKCNENLMQVLNNGKINNLPNMFLAMARDANEKNLPSATLVVGLGGDDTRGVLPGQYIPQLWLVIHRMPDEKDVNEHSPTPGENS